MMEWIVTAKFISLNNITPEQAQKIFEELYNLETLGCTGINFELLQERERVSGALYSIDNRLKELGEELEKATELRVEKESSEL